MVQEATAKARVLIEALPFLKRFHHQVTVVKVGGEAVERPEVLDALLTDIVFLEQVGIRPVLVHGGGAGINRAMTVAGIQPRWHAGRRITDAETMRIVLQEVERINLQLVNRLFELGAAAIGLLPSRQAVVFGRVTDPELGLVGTPERIDRERIVRFTSRGMVPVIPPLSVGQDGASLNTNADDIALAVATGMTASKLVFCSSVPGVCRDPKDPATRIPSLTPSEVRRLIKDGVVTGGMIPKVESCLAALASGVGKIHIVDAAMPHALLLEIFTQEGIGTELYDPDATCQREGMP